MEKAEQTGDNSGSCAAVVLIVDDQIYNVWTGDSRIILSREGGKNIYQVSKDHKPGVKIEY